MTEFNIEQARSNMIEQQIRPWEVLDQAVLEVMAAVPRERFVPQRYRKLAFADLEIPLGHDQVMMSPKVEGRLLQALDIQPTDNILEIGTGSGYTAACMARLGSQVETVDIFKDFTQRAKENLSRIGLNEVKLQTGDAVKGWPNDKRFDVIALTGSLPVYDRCFEHNLEIGGRLFVIVGERPVMEAMLILRVGERDFFRDKLFETAIPALVHATPAPEFVF
jgi:protein-L-isoaspartate(D-aspartate) O-methyltransferase